MITLDPILQTAQDSIERSPIINLNSASFVEPIPFEGQAFNTGTDDEYHPDMISLSSGRIVSVIERDWDLILLISNEDNTEWVEHTIYNPGSLMVNLVGSIVELTDGNLGIIIIEKQLVSSYKLRRMVVSLSGSVVTVASDIFTSAYQIVSPSVELLSNNTYLLTYVYKNASNQYSIQTRTSSDFLTWSSATTIYPSGLTDTNRLANTTIRQLDSGEIFILFDYLEGVSSNEELINIYSIQSTDNGVSWSSPDKITNYTDYGTYAKHPTIAERNDNTTVIAFQEERDLLQINFSDASFVGSSYPATLYFNSGTQKLHSKRMRYQAGYTSSLQGCAVIDIPSWNVDKIWSKITTPDFNNYYFNKQQVYPKAFDAGKYIISAPREDGVDLSIMVLDVELDTIRDYVFADNPTYSLIKNIDIDLGVAKNLQGFQFEEDTDRLFLFSGSGGFNYANIQVRYIDLSIPADPITGMYPSEAHTYIASISFPIVNNYAFFDSVKAYSDLDMILLSVVASSGIGSGGALKIINFAGSTLYTFDYLTTPGFHKNGIINPVLVNNHVYGGFLYELYYGQENRYGLMDIDLASGSIRYHRPSWGTYTNYYLEASLDMGDNRILFTTANYGITIFDILSETWTIYNTSTLPALGRNDWVSIQYDPIDKMIFASGWGGIVAFPEVGVFQQLKYITGEYDAGWTYSAITNLVNEYTNSQPTIAIDPDDVLWCLWTHRDSSEYSTYWSQEGMEKDLTSYLVNSPVTIKWRIDSPASLTFELSHGHLFDTTNTMSLLALFLKQGRRIEVQIGELISGTEYFQNQGSFIVNSIQLSYSKGEYPTVNVSCEDYRSIWKQTRIVASDYYSSQYPSTIISDLLEEHANIDSEDIDMPSFSGRYYLYHQFIDQDLNEMIISIIDHFNYFFYVDVDSKYTARQINLLGSVDHIYSEAEIVNYTPDNSYSNFLNRIIVKGEGRYELEVLYPVEIVAQLNGTIGWWGGNEVKRVYYSEDRERKCRNPYLEIMTSIQEFEIFTIQGGGKEYISLTDSEEYYIEITIESPNLVAMIIGVAAAILAVGVAAIICTVNCGPYVFALTILSQIMAYMLGTIAQYDYNIWASPIGYTKQTFQSAADDLVFQRELNGLIVADEIDDPFCYTLTQCQVVANNELSVVKAQRKGVSFKKIAHLQDEVGDIIQINHPYTGLSLKLFIPGLTRIYQTGDSIIDNIEGWLI